MTMRSRMWLPWCVAAASFLSFSLLACASEMFVDAATGNDEFGNGSAIRPWRSIQKALDENPGAEVTVWVGPGTYTEQIVPPPSLKVLHIIGPGATYASVEATSLPDDDAALVLTEGQTCLLEGLTLVGGGWDVPTGGQTIRRNGANLEMLDCAVSYVRWWNEPVTTGQSEPATPPKTMLESPKAATPEPGFFAGFNSQNLPMTLVVASTAQELRTFRFHLRTTCSNCILNTSVGTEWTSGAPRIVNGAFDFTLRLGGNDWRFTGAFESPRNVDGNWYAPAWDKACGACSGQGTWTALRELFQPDVNHDELVNAIDIQLVINDALSLLPAAGGDINGDGQANAIDIQLVVNAVLGMVIR